MTTVASSPMPHGGLRGELLGAVGGLRLGDLLRVVVGGALGAAAQRLVRVEPGEADVQPAVLRALDALVVQAVPGAAAPGRQVVGPARRAVLLLGRGNQVLDRLLGDRAAQVGQIGELHAARRWARRTWRWGSRTTRSPRSSCRRSRSPTSSRRLRASPERRRRRGCGTGAGQIGAWFLHSDGTELSVREVSVRAVYGRARSRVGTSSGQPRYDGRRSACAAAESPRRPESGRSGARRAGATR